MKIIFDNLIFGNYNRFCILEAVNNFDWQIFRISLKTKSRSEKFKALREWLTLNQYSSKSKIQVTNYISNYLKQ